MKSERGSPLQGGGNSSSSSEQTPKQQHPSTSLPSHSPSLAPSPVQPSSSNLLATQTGATSISITKQPPQSQPTTTNVIIKPPVIKDIGNHLSSSTTTTSSSAAAVTSGGGGNGATSLVVSVPLSPVSVGGGGGGGPLSLPGGTLGSNSNSSASSSASQNLFQQAIQNRSEHLNFSSTGSSRSSSQPNQAALSRSSPIIAGTASHMGGDHHGGMQHHRQSPLIQSSNLGMLDNGGRGSLSPSMGGNVVHQSDSGMLKVTYEKQAVHGNIVNPTGGAQGRLAALQDDAMSSSRRSR